MIYEVVGIFDKLKRKWSLQNCGCKQMNQN